MSLKFLPGYYEWNLYDNDELLYTWGDFLEDLPENVTEEAACDEADCMMFAYREDCEEQGKEVDDALIVSATELIANEIYRRYGTDGKANLLCNVL